MDKKYGPTYQPLFDEFGSKWGVPQKDLTMSWILGYVDTYQTIMFNGDVYPHFPFELSEQSKALVEPFRALGFYVGYFGNERSIKLANEAFR